MRVPFHVLSSPGDVRNPEQKGSQCMSANQNQVCVSFLPACSGLYLMELGIKQEMQQLLTPSDPNSYIIPENVPGSGEKKIHAFKNKSWN